ncbi:MAG: DsrE family protein, partial [Chloroflexota bacterium]
QGQNDLLQKIEQMAKAGVEIQGCANSLHEHNIDQAALPRYIKVVPSGVVAVAEAQNEGFAYVKP